MLEVIEKLLILQDRDRKISRVKAELGNVGPERQALLGRLAGSQTALDAAKHKVKQIETERKKLELEVEARKGQIEKYSVQQFQTKKNEEYRALANEIGNCKAHIVQLEDQQLELMEKAEAAQKDLSVAAANLAEATKVVEGLVAELATRETALKRQLEELENGHARLQEEVEEGARSRYERLRRSKGETAVVGIDHSVCGGCHMKLPIQVVRSCQAQQELVSCPNCGRLLYYTPHMDLVVVD